MEHDNNGVGLIGPMWPHYKATVGGYLVPDVQITKLDGENDGRYNISVGHHVLLVDRDGLDDFLPFLAHAMAWAAGYTTHGKNAKLRNPYNTQAMFIGSVETTTDENENQP